MRQKFGFTKLKNPLQSLRYINIVSLIFNVESDKKNFFVGIRNPLVLENTTVFIYISSQIQVMAR